MGGVSSRASSLVCVPYHRVARFASADLRLPADLFHNVFPQRSSPKRTRGLSSGKLDNGASARVAPAFGSLRLFYLYFCAPFDFTCWGVARKPGNRNRHTLRYGHFVRPMALSHSSALLRSIAFMS